MPVAVTDRLTGAPAVTVAPAGCVVIVGATSGGVAVTRLNGPQSPKPVEKKSGRTWSR